MMIDFHCHILSKMDDGSDSINTSLAMLREEHTQGVNRVVLTPHFYCEEESIEAFLQRRKRLFLPYKPLFPTNRIQTIFQSLCLGAEVAMSSALAQMDLQPLCISGTNVLLLELPYYRRFRLKDVETIINRNDIQVVFAHIERFSRLWNKETFAAVMELPVYKQINCRLSLSCSLATAAAVAPLAFRWRSAPAGYRRTQPHHSPCKLSGSCTAVAAKAANG